MMKKFTKGQTRRLVSLLSRMHAAELEPCDSDARDEYEHLATVLAATLVLYGAPPSADVPHSTRK